MEISATAMLNRDMLRIDQLTKRLDETALHEQERLREATRDFEALFVKQMLDAMRNTVQKSGLLDGGFAEQTYEDMLYDEYAQQIAKTANLGIADMLYQQMSAYL